MPPVGNPTTSTEPSAGGPTRCAALGHGTIEGPQRAVPGRSRRAHPASQDGWPVRHRLTTRRCWVHHDSMWRVVAVAVTALSVSACSSPSRSTAASVGVGGTLGQPGCTPASPVANGEVQGSASPGISLWGLTFGQPLAARTQIKMVWRMTGDGPLVVTPVAPDGRSRSLSWGPAYHLSSSWHRPGQEWGTGFLFDQPGCWHIELSRTIGRADVYLEITPTA